MYTSKLTPDSVVTYLNAAFVCISFTIYIINNKIMIYLKMTNLCYFKRDNPRFQHFQRCLYRARVIGSEKSRFAGDEMRMQIWR